MINALLTLAEEYARIEGVPLSTVSARVFDDGKKTFFRFPGEVPAIYAVDPARHESVVNVHRENDYVIVDKVNPQWTLRIGEQRTCIFNLRTGNVLVNTGLGLFGPQHIPSSLSTPGAPNAIAK